MVLRQAVPKEVVVGMVGEVGRLRVVVTAGAGEPVLLEASPVVAAHPLLAYPDTAKSPNSSDLSPQF